MRYGKNYQTGLSIVELMVGITLGLVLTAGAIQLFISTKATYRLENALSRLQETGRFAVDIIAEQVRMAGYAGCSSRVNADINIISNEQPPLDVTMPENALRGYDSTGTGWTPNLPAYITSGALLGANVLAGTDVLIIQGIAACSAVLTTRYNAGDNLILVNRPNGCNFAARNAVMINDCATTDLFAISAAPAAGGAAGTEILTFNMGGNAGQNNGTLSKNYDIGAQVSIYQSSVFYISEDGGEPVLFQGVWDPTVDAVLGGADFRRIELAGGVEDMQILYGEDTDDDGAIDAYRTANNVADWENVRSVRIDLLLQSADNVTAEPRAFRFNNADINTGADRDRRLRIRHSITIALRNRLP